MEIGMLKNIEKHKWTEVRMLEEGYFRLDITEGVSVLWSVHNKGNI